MYEKLRTKWILILLIGLFILPATISAIEWTNQTCINNNQTLNQERIWIHDGTSHNQTQAIPCQYGCTEAFGVGRCNDGPFRPIPTEIFAIFELFGLVLLFMSIREEKIIYPTLGFIVFAALSLMSFNVGPIDSAISHAITGVAAMNFVFALVCLIYIFGRIFGVITEVEKIKGAFP